MTLRRGLAWHPMRLGSSSRANRRSYILPDLSAPETDDLQHQETPMTEKWYRSTDDGPWEPIPPPTSGSLLRASCQTPGQVWHDGYGNQYKFEMVEQP